MGFRLASIRDALKKPHVYWPIAIALLGLAIAIGSYFVIGRWLDSIVIGLGVVIIGLMVVVLRTFLDLEREERLERGVEDSPADERERAGGESPVDALRRTIDEIRASRLGAEGVDALPWLLVIGAPGEGKTAAIRESGLDLPAEYARRVSGAPTESCDSWLTNDAIVFDLAGRYLACADDETRAEWIDMLRALRKQRPGCAINGLLFAVSIDTLLGCPGAQLDDLARSLRRRVNEATDELGVDLPVYIVVTKLDHLEGFVECASASPVLQSGRALGWTNDQRMLADPEQRVAGGLSAIVARLESVLPEFILREPDLERRRRIFAFPAELEHVVNSVAHLVGRAFAPTPYDAPPYLRGVYFTSALRQGSTLSSQLERLGFNWARSSVDDSLALGGIMLSDLFTEIVIGDQNLALPTDRFGPRTRRAVKAAAAFTASLLVLWWSVSFAINLAAIRRLQLEARAVLAGASSLASLDAMRESISRESDDLRFLRRGGLGGAMQSALERARTSYNWGFGREFEAPTRRRLQATVTGFDTGAFEALAQLATDVTWLARRADEQSATRPDLSRYAPISANPSDVEVFLRCYDAFVRWGSHTEVQARIRREAEVVGSAAARLLELDRLEAWAESSASYPAASYADSGLPGADQSTVEVSGVYTARAWKGLVVRLLDAIDATGTASGKAKQFRQTYVRRYDDKWREFLMATPTPAHRFADAEGSPYLDFLARMTTNTSVDLPRRESPPPWVLALREVQRQKALEELASDDVADAEKPPEPPPPWPEYNKALALVAADVEAARSDTETAIGLAVQMAQRQGTNFEKALKLIDSIVPKAGDPEAAAKLEEILSMPVLDAASDVLGRAFSELDRRWQARVARPYSGALSARALSALYSRQGDLAQFRQSELGPFYKDGRAKSVIGSRRLPLGPAFLRWMRAAEALERTLGNSGLSTGGRVTVRLQGVPAQVIGNSRIRVAEREIRMRCDDGNQIFRYTEGMGQYAFKWAPNCDDVSLHISALEGGKRRELAPAKEWKGPMALALFLQQADQSGHDLRWTLHYADSGVTVIMIYRLRSGRELLTMRHTTPPGSMGN